MTENKKVQNNLKSKNFVSCYTHILRYAELSGPTQIVFDYLYIFFRENAFGLCMGFPSIVSMFPYSN